MSSLVFVSCNAIDRGTQDDRDDTRDDHMRRERSLLLLSALASDALDELSGLSKVGGSLSRAFSISWFLAQWAALA